MAGVARNQLGGDVVITMKNRRLNRFELWLYNSPEAIAFGWLLVLGIVTALALLAVRAM